jgi:hypothetical protein
MEQPSRLTNIVAREIPRNFGKMGIVIAVAPDESDQSGNPNI